MADAFNNIGYVYSNQGNIAKAFEYCYKSLKLQEEIGNKPGLASSLSTIVGVKIDQ